MTYTLPRLGFCALSKLTCGTCGAVECMIVERAQYQWRKRTIAMQRHNSNAKLPTLTKARSTERDCQMPELHDLMYKTHGLSNDYVKSPTIPRTVPSVGSNH
jgi:hypothetical protein